MDDDAPKTLLITLTGKDRPGVTSAVFSTLAAFGVSVLDIEQIVLRASPGARRPRDGPPRLEGAADRAGAGWPTSLDMQVDVDRGTGDNRSRPEGRSHVTVLGMPLKPAAVAAIAGRIADTGANIDRIERMARYPVTAIEMHVSGADPHRLRAMLAEEAAAQSVDVAVQPATLLRHGMRLVVMDVDSTLVQGEVIEMLAEHAGCLDEVRAVTERAMHGDLDFEESLHARVALLAGLDASALDRVYDDLVLAPGARTLVRTLKRLGYRFAIVSGGFTHVTDRIAADLGIDFAAANELEVVDGRLTGRIVGPVVDRAGKAEALRRFAAEVGRLAGRDGRDRRRGQRPGHAVGRGARHRLQRQARRAEGRRHGGERALPRRDHVPPRHQPGGGRGGRRPRRAHHPGASPRMNRVCGAAQPWPT